MGIRETDLYDPVRTYLTERGYIVRGEVHGCDVVAMKGEDTVIVELKRSPGLGLLVQAAQRQRLSDSVYVAVPPPRTARSREWRGFLHLLRRLEIGLLVVTPDPASVTVVLHPQPFERRKGNSRKKRRALIEEATARGGDHNVGGSTRRKLMTAYREAALRIAVGLDLLGIASPKALRALGTSPKTQRVLYDNVYGWFARREKAQYELTASGRAALAEYAVLAARHREKLSEAVMESSPVRSTAASG